MVEAFPFSCFFFFPIADGMYFLSDGVGLLRQPEPSDLGFVNGRF